MSEPQPWRNPRPAAHLPQMQPHLGPLLVPAWLRAWWPAILWAAFIFTLSTDTFSAAHTSSWLEPIVRWLAPSITDDQFDFIHACFRKTAHFTEYFVFGLLLYRGVRSAGKGWRWSWGLTALSVAAGYAILDEVHQAFIASRTASPYDSLLDSIGSFFAIAFLYFWFRFRSARRGTVPAPETAPSS